MLYSTYCMFSLLLKCFKLCNIKKNEFSPISHIYLSGSKYNSNNFGEPSRVQVTCLGASGWPQAGTSWGDKVWIHVIKER